MFLVKLIDVITNNKKTEILGQFIVRNKFLFFIIIFALQLFFNLYKIGENSLWFDECFTVNSANRSIADIIEISKVDPNPPLYIIIVHYWIDLFGISEYAVRSLSAVAGALSCSFLFLFSLRFLNWQTGVFSVFMFFTSNAFFYYSQEARTYSFVLLFVVLSNYCYLRIADSITIWKGIIFSVLLGLFNIGLFYLHFLSCFNIVGQVLFLPFLLLTFQSEVYSEGKSTWFSKIKLNVNFLKYYIFSWIVFFALMAPFFIRFFYLVKEGGKTWWLQKPVYQDLKNSIYDLFNSRDVYQIYVYSFIVIIFLLLFKKLRNDSFKIKYLIFGIIFGPGLLYLNYLIASYSPIFLTRYFLFVYLGMITTICYAYSALKVRFEIKFILFLIPVFYASTKMQIPRQVKQDYKNAVKYLSSVKNDNVLITTDLQDVFAYYYNKKIFNISNGDEKAKALFRYNIFYQNYDLDWPNRLDFSNIKDIYYTQSFAYLNDGDRVIMSKLGSKFEFVEKIDKFKEVYILHYVNRNCKSIK